MVLKIPKPQNTPKRRQFGFFDWIKNTCHNQLQLYKNLFFDAKYFGTVSWLFLWTEVLVSIFVVEKVKYTEIDWIAYMQEVEGFVVNKSLDYTTMKGDTGPLVYPAGHLYIYTILYYITDSGRNVRLAQYIFIGFYLLTLLAVFRVYTKAGNIPPYVLVFLTLTAYRIHSIFMLRLFNDPLAMLLLYGSILLMLKNRWSWASLAFSLAVSIKMNILLFSPGLLALFLISCGWKGTLINLTICGSVQLILAAPFLYGNAFGYINRSFDFGRVFFHIWTVNWRFLPENIFVDKRFHFLLLLLHLSVLAFFSWKVWFKHNGGLKQMLKNKTSKLEVKDILFVLFSSNLIGITFSRSLHYQFYVWYFHSLPFLLWSIENWSPVFRICLLGLIELSWNTYPSTNWSSALLYCSHLIILMGLYCQNGFGKKVIIRQKMQ